MKVDALRWNPELELGNAVEGAEVDAVPTGASDDVDEDDAKEGEGGILVFGCDC